MIICFLFSNRVMPSICPSNVTIALDSSSTNVRVIDTPNCTPATGDIGVHTVRRHSQEGKDYSIFNKYRKKNSSNNI